MSRARVDHKVQDCITGHETGGSMGAKVYQHTDEQELFGGSKNTGLQDVGYGEDIPWPARQSSLGAVAQQVGSRIVIPVVVCFCLNCCVSVGQFGRMFASPTGRPP